MLHNTSKNSINDTTKERITILLEKRTFLQADSYSAIALERGLLRRLELLKISDSSQYLEKLSNDQDEINALAREIIQQDKQSEHRFFYEALFQNSFDGIVVYDLQEQYILDSNDAFSDIFGYSKEEVKYINPLDLLHTESRKEFIPIFENMAKTLSQGVEQNYTHLYVRKNGEVFHANISFLPVETNPSQKALIMVRDLTEILERESLIEEGQASFQSIFNLTPLGICVTDTDDTIVDVNQAFLHLFGYDSHEILGKSFSSELCHLPSSRVEENQAKIKQLLNKEVDYIEFENRYKKKNGDLFVSRVWVNTMLKQGKKYFITCIQDFTAQHEIDAAIKEKEERYRSLFNNQLQGVIVINPKENKAIDANPIILEMFGTNLDEFLNSNIIIDQSPRYQFEGYQSKDRIEAIMEDFKAVPKEIEFNWQFKRLPYHQIFDARVSISPVKLKGEDAIVMFVEDLTEQKQAERKIAQQIADMERKNRQLEHYIQSNLELESFAYVASHDLKQPLRSIASFTQLLRRRYKDKLGEDANEYMEFILNNVHNMKQLIQDLLSYSKVNTRDLDVVEVNLNDLVFELIEIYNTPENEGVEFIVEDLPTTFIANRTKLRQVFQNLIGNAIKFRKSDAAPRIEIYCQDLGNEYQFTISDNGIGIQAEYKEKIFLVFKRLHTKVEYEGSGIGLAICKKIIEQHGGEITVESVYGEGASFIFTLKKDLEALEQI